MQQEPVLPMKTIKKLPEACASLNDVRFEIDTIDREIIAALGRRLAYVKAAAAFKPTEESIAAPERVGAMIAERRIWAEDAALNADFVGPLFAQIIHWFIAQQVHYWRELRSPGWSSGSRQRSWGNLQVQENEFFFSSKFRTLHGRGLKPIQVGQQADSASILLATSKAFSEMGESGPSPIVVGAIPFSSDSAACLFASQSAEVFLPSSDERSRSCRELEKLDPIKILDVPRPEAYMASVERALAILNNGNIKKIVLARTLEISIKSAVNISHLISKLARGNPSSFTFSVPVWTEEDFYSFVGVSPELLVQKMGRRIITNPLAGSIRRGATPEEDLANSERLLASAKDRYEHSIVVAAVMRALGPFCTRLTVSDEPSLIKTPTVWHLGTNIVGELLTPEISSLELALALHPTPAVCGDPKDSALRAIMEIEEFDRRLYAGLVGWMDAKGDGEWAVALRCAEIGKQRVRLFAGAGIVNGSRPEVELAETTAKLRTMLDALGIEGPFYDHAHSALKS